MITVAICRTLQFSELLYKGDMVLHRTVDIIATACHLGVVAFQWMN